MTSRSTPRLGAALIGAMAALALTTAVALAHPESEGEHGGCIVTAEPGTIAVGGQFTVADNFGGASIWVLAGADATVPEGMAPSATTPAGASSFSVTFTATGDPGELTVFAAIEGSECGDTDHITVTAGTLPNTASNDQADELAAIVGLALLGAAFVAARTRPFARRA